MKLISWIFRLFELFLISLEIFSTLRTWGFEQIILICVYLWLFFLFTVYKWTFNVRRVLCSFVSWFTFTRWNGHMPQLSCRHCKKYSHTELSCWESSQWITSRVSVLRQRISTQHIESSWTTTLRWTVNCVKLFL